MSRRRYISTDISTDPKLAELAEHGPLPLLLYTWSIPHMDDWGRMTGDARQFKLLVCPALDVTAREVDEALDCIARVGLWQRYEVDGRQYIAIPLENWFKHQTYINKSKRSDDSASQFPPPPNAEEQRKTPKNTEDEREGAQNTVSPSPSPSPSLSPSLSKDADEEVIGTSPTPDVYDRIEQYMQTKMVNPKYKLITDDYHAVQRLLGEGITEQAIYEGIDHAFATYKEKYPGDRIRTFAYCVPVILQLWHTEQTKQQTAATGGVKLEYQVSSRTSAGTSQQTRGPNGRTRSITGGKVGRV